MAMALAIGSGNPYPEHLMKELLVVAEADRFKTGIEAIIQQLQTSLKQSYKRIRKLETSLTHSYNRIGKIHEVDNDHVVFHDSSDAVQKEIESSIEVAKNINTIFKSILPRHTLDYVYGKEKFFLVNFSKSENLKVSKFHHQKKTEFVRNKIVDLAVKLYNLRSKINGSVLESFRYGQFCRYGTQDSVSVYPMTTSKNFWENKNNKVITERDEIMMKIEKAMEDLEGILFRIYVMVQIQVAINAYAISEKWSERGGVLDNMKRLAEKEKKRFSKRSVSGILGAISAVVWDFFSVY